MKSKTALDIVRRLVGDHVFDFMVDCCHEITDTGTKRTRGRPGELIERLPPDEREKLKQLKAEDMNNERWPNPDNLFDKTEDDRIKREKKVWRRKICP